MRNKAELMMLMLFSISLFAWAGNDLKPGKVKKEIRQECRKQRGACTSYRQKDYKKSDKFKISRNKINR